TALGAGGAGRALRAGGAGAVTALGAGGAGRARTVGGVAGGAAAPQLLARAARARLAIRRATLSSPAISRWATIRPDAAFRPGPGCVLAPMCQRPSTGVRCE